MERLSVITPTYRADLEMVRELCASMDRHFGPAFHHFLIVPKVDVPLFSDLANPHRTVLSKESVLGRHGFRKLPFPARIRIPLLLDRRFKEQWYLPGAGRLSGWLVQQLIKLSAPEITTDEHLLFVDSDVVIVRDFGWHHVVRDGMVRLHEHAKGVQHETHRRWRDSALALLGMPPEEGPPINYIGQLITWRRSMVVEVQQRIEAATGMDWRLAIARRREVSEYILYGYACRDRPPEESGHIREDLELVHSLWMTDADSERLFEEGLEERHIAVHVQSILPMSPSERTRRIRAAMDAELTPGGSR